MSFKPGERSDYCDVNYNMLGMVIHQVTGKPYHAFLRERVFARLNMNAIRHHDWRAIVPNRAAGYAWEAGELKNCEGIKWHPLSDTTQAVPANGANGSLLCSVNDLAKWDAALYTEQIIAQATLQQMWTPTTLTDGTKAGAGLGWQIDEKNGLRLAAHGGMNPAFGVWYGRYVEEQLAVIVFINLGFGSEEWTEERGPAPWVIGNRIAEVYNPTLKRG